MFRGYEKIVAGRKTGRYPLRMTDDEAYRVLGVSPGSDAKGVQRAYRERALEAHPDRAGSDGERAIFTKRFLRVRDAYEYLRKAGFPVPAPEEVVEDPPEIRTYHRSFAKPWDEEEFSQAEKLGVQWEWSLEGIILWGVIVPCGAIGAVLFLRYWLAAAGGG